MLIRRGHESVLEHVCATFIIICDRGISHELVRHRIAAYSQESTRYCKYTVNPHVDNSGMEVICPFDEEDEAFDRWLMAMVDAEAAYRDLIEAGYAAQFARSVLPTCLKTEVVATMNIRQWRHVLQQRLNRRAHPQIRKIMLQILKIFLKDFQCFVEDIPIPDDIKV